MANVDYDKNMFVECGDLTFIRALNYEVVLPTIRSIFRFKL